MKKESQGTAEGKWWGLERQEGKPGLPGSSGAGPGLMEEAVLAQGGRRLSPEELLGAQPSVQLYLGSPSSWTLSGSQDLAGSQERPAGLNCLDSGDGGRPCLKVHPTCGENSLAEYLQLLPVLLAFV